jgi:hypothetical protein
MTARKRPNDVLFVAALVAVTCAAVWPVWAVRHLPLVDYPNQLANAAVAARLGDPSWRLAPLFEAPRWPLPYVGWVMPVRALGALVGFDWAAKIWLTLALAAFPVGVALLARQLGRSPWLALFAAPLALSDALQRGFVSFVGGAALLPFALVALDRVLERPTARRAVVLALATVAIYCLHVLPWLLFGAIALAWVVLAAAVRHGDARRVRAAAIASVAMLPSVVLGVVAFRLARAGGTSVVDAPLAIEGRFEPLVDRLSALPSRLLAGWSSSGWSWALIVLTAVWLAILVSARTDERDTAAARAGHPLRLELAFVVALLALLVAPEDVSRPVVWTVVASRFALFVALLGALLPHGPLVGRRALLLVAPIVLVAVVYPVRLARAWQPASARIAALRSLLRRVPRGEATFVHHATAPVDAALPPALEPLRHAHAYVLLDVGGDDPEAAEAGFPLHRRADAPPRPPSVLGASTIEAVRKSYRWVVARGERAVGESFGPDSAAVAEFIAEAGEWRLYRMRPEERSP